MNYLDALESELAAAGIPRRQRTRIVTEFADHLHENPNAELGVPSDLARQFADELGTRLARATAYRVFAALAFAAVALAAMVVAAGGMRGLTVYGHHRVATPTWTAPILLVAALAAQVALATGGLTLLRAWRLRHEPVISRADAIVLARRSAVAAVSGTVTMAALPAAALAYPHTAGATWSALAWIVAGVSVAGLAATLPMLVRGARLLPSHGGEAGDLKADLGVDDPRITPWRVATALSLLIFVGLAALGVRADDPYDGLARGLLDAGACMAGFIVLGRYLGLRTAS